VVFRVSFCIGILFDYRYDCQANASMATQWKTEDVEMKVLEDDMNISDQEWKVTGADTKAAHEERENIKVDRKISVMKAMDGKKESRILDDLRQPKKRFVGRKPFKPLTRTTVLGDIYNEALH